MDFPSQKTISHSEIPQDAETAILGYRFTSGDTAKIWPVGGAESDVSTLTGPEGQIEVPIGKFRKWIIETPNERTSLITWLL